VRHLLAFFALPASGVLPLAMAEVAIGTNLTIILDFENSPSLAAMNTMRSEVSHLLRRTGVKLDFAVRKELSPYQDFEDLVLVRLRGTCRMAGLAPLMDERGPLGWSHTVEGSILPFGEVSCDQVRRVVEAAVYGRGGPHARELLFGRALGRVLAHELYHIIGATHRHGRRGITQAALSAQELVAERLEIAPEDVAHLVGRLRERAALPSRTTQ